MTKKHIVPTERCGDINVFVQGDIHLAEKRAVFMTIHDIGCNHTSFHDFVEHPAMSEITSRSIFIHVDVPGQEDGSPDLLEGYNFPTLQILAEDLVTVLDFLHLKYAVVLGEGAGANVATRFAMAYPSRTLGVILIHPTSSVAGIMENVKDKMFIGWQLSNVGMTPTAEQYLVYHRFGESFDEQVEQAENKGHVLEEFQERLRSSINSKNLRLFVNAFLKRTDITASLREKLTVDALLITGSRSSYKHSTSNMFSAMNPAKSQMIQIEGVGDALNESPEKVAQSLLLFVKGIGLLTSMTMVGVERQRTFSSGSATSDDGTGNPGCQPRQKRSMSMEEYDRPNLRRLTSREEPLPE